MDILITSSAVVLLLSLVQLTLALWRLAPDSDEQIRRFQSQYRRSPVALGTAEHSDADGDLMNEWSLLFESGVTGG